MSDYLRALLQQLGPDVSVPAAPAAPDIPIPTPLQVDQPGFRDWYTTWATRERMNPNPDARGQDYDYRKAFRRGVTPPRTSLGEHWPSEAKAKGHPNRVVGGFDTVTGERVPGTPRARTVDELISLGWEPTTAHQLMSTPEPRE